MGSPLETPLAACSHQGSRIPERWWDCSGLDRRSEGIPGYTYAKMVFILQATVVATGCFV